MISKDKTYRTKDGREVRIYATDGGEREPVHGAIKEDIHWITYAWNLNGRAILNSETGYDLIEVRPRHKRTVWLNVYEHVTQGCYESKWEADSCAGKDRIACIKVELDFEEGEGL